ncbi:hypothetical protein IMX17_09205 [Serratia sp. X3]|uniref:hypothetical protein n=1 Tax=Serratia sp. X3 TaxID=2780495 RepID=UPI0018758D47|nr:hypothetical protein [Serratia sp. X3]MBE4973570.1 hypothetical protein [Serratia sp. X3]
MNNKKTRKIKVSKQTPDSYRFSILVCDLDEKDDLEAVIMGGAYLERILEVSIVSKLMEINPNFDLETFASHSMLKDFEHKITMALHLGIFDVAIYKQLKLIKDIRNMFAHSVVSLGFDNEAIKNKAANLDPFEIYDVSGSAAELPGITKMDLDVDYTFINENGKEISGKEHMFVISGNQRICAYMCNKERNSIITSRDKFIYSVQMAWLLLMVGVFSKNINLITNEVITSFN